MFTFSFDVCTAHNDDVKDGRLCTAHMLVDVMADTFVDAQLVAAQMAAGMTGGMPTLALVRI